MCVAVASVAPGGGGAHAPSAAAITALCHVAANMVACVFAFIMISHGHEGDASAAAVWYATGGVLASIVIVARLELGDRGGMSKLVSA